MAELVGNRRLGPSVKDRATLHEGQRVEYAIAFGSLGIEAADVRPLDTTP
ncbi:MAG: hypothetical protein ACM3QU_09670 [Verrucomicrobiota bacterium]